MRRFEGRVAVVTGAASGIGQATAELLARRGCNLALVDVNEAGMHETGKRVCSIGRKVSLHSVDVADKARMQALPEEVIHEHGYVHVVVNNAGVLVSGTLEAQTLEDLEWVVGINFWGVVYGCRFFLPYLKREDEAHIVNLSSMFGFMGIPSLGLYCATKSAVRAVSEALWAELADTNIGVTSLHPGLISTNLARAARASDEEAKQHVARLFERSPTSPERVARGVVHAIEHNKRQVTICPEAYLVEWAKRLLPGMAHRFVAWKYHQLRRSMSFKSIGTKADGLGLD